MSPGPRIQRHLVAARGTQRGITLLVALIFLLMFALLAAATLNGTLTSAQAIGNMQWRSEAIAAADDAIDQILSSNEFAKNSDGLTAQVNATPFRFDANGDGVSDITVNLPTLTFDGTTKAGPRCLRYRSIPLASLDPAAANDIGCFGSSAAENSGLGMAEQGGSGTLAFAAGQSICANTEWVIPVRAADPVTNTSVDVFQGVGVRTFVSDAENACK